MFPVHDPARLDLSSNNSCTLLINWSIGKIHPDTGLFQLGLTLIKGLLELDGSRTAHLRKVITTIMALVERSLLHFEGHLSFHQQDNLVNAKIPGL